MEEENNNDIRLYDNELAEMVRDVKCSQMTFMLDCCYSGGFIDDLMNDNYAACKNRSVHTCTDATHVGYVEQHITRRNRGDDDWQRVDEFVYYWSAALLGYYPILEQHGDSLLGPWYQFENTAIGQFPWDQITSFDEGNGYSHVGYDVNPDTDRVDYKIKKNKDLAFDHPLIIYTGINRLKNKQRKCKLRKCLLL